MKRYNKYKDSGVEWIGKIPEHWNISRINFLSSKVGDGLHGTPSYVDESPFAFINGNNIGEGTIILTDKTKFVSEHDYLKNRKELTDNTILMSINGTIGNLAYYNGETVMLGKSAAYINLLPNINKEYIYFYLKSKSALDYIFRELSGSTINNLSLYSTNKTPIPFPSTQEQTQIANYLNHKTAQLDTLIAKKEQLISLLQEERTAMINQAVTKGLDPNVAMKDSGIEWLGDIPEHWNVVKVKHFTEKIGSGVTPRGGAEVYQETGVPLLRSQNIYFDRFKIDNVAFISEEIHNSMNNSKVFKGDVLLNITGGSIGRCFYLTDEFKEANVNQHVCIVRPNENIVTEYLHLLLSSDGGQIQISLCQQGGNREALNFEQLKNFPFALPNIERAIKNHRWSPRK
ncbi:MAG: restriction endonuclease subunit S [Gelidibacter sp.]